MLLEQTRQFKYSFELIFNDDLKMKQFRYLARWNFQERFKEKLW